MNNVVTGSIAGLISTAPMTAAMKLMHARLPPEQRHPLPPRPITMGVAHAVGADEALDTEPEQRAATIAGHFAYGAACGALYGAVGERLPGRPAAKGAAFGLAVWAGSYLGWVPAVGLLPPATREPRERVALMIAAHVVFGAATGLLFDALAHRADGRRAARPRRVPAASAF